MTHLDGARSGSERQTAKAADLGKEEEEDDDDKVDDAGSVIVVCNGDATRFHTDTSRRASPRSSACGRRRGGVFAFPRVFKREDSGAGGITRPVRGFYPLT